MNSDQLRYDELHEMWVHAESEELGAHCERLLDDLPKVALFCPRHLTSHELSVREIEQLVYGMLGNFSDSCSISPDDDGADDRKPDEIVAQWCPLDELKWMSDGEAYREHIDGMIESRKAH